MIDSVAVGNAPLLQVAQEDERRTAQGQTKRRALQKKKKNEISPHAGYARGSIHSEPHVLAQIRVLQPMTCYPPI